MIADALKITTERLAERSLVRNQLWLHAANGTATPAMVAHYLQSLRYLVGNTTACLTHARDRARALGDHALVAFMDDKYAEEDGHEQWADSDVRFLEDRFPLAQAAPVPGIVALMDYVRSVIERDPKLYLAYMFWAEYFTALVGGKFSDALVLSCGIPRGALTCLDKHVELDVEHAEEGMEVLDRFVTDPTLVHPLRQVIETAADMFDAACAQIVTAGDEPDRIAS